jgi:hypothetical protein
VAGLAATADARGSGGHASGSHAGKSDGHTSTSKKSKRSASEPASVSGASRVARDSHGRIVRSEAAKHAFEVQSGYPQGRPGYVVDHIKPLACGGADEPFNMQWQTVSAAKGKDRVERAGVPIGAASVRARSSHGRYDIAAVCSDCRGARH